MSCKNPGIDAEFDRRGMHAEIFRTGGRFEEIHFLVLKFVKSSTVVTNRSVILRSQRNMQLLYFILEAKTEGRG